jgi:hypothetical protein
VRSINAYQRMKESSFAVVDEMDTEAEKSQDQIEGTVTLQSNQGQAGVAGQAEVADNSLAVPGDKRPLTSPLDGSLPKKRPRSICQIKTRPRLSHFPLVRPSGYKSF